MQDSRKGRRAEIAEVNGPVVDVLAAQSRAALVSARVVQIALESEAGRLRAQPENVTLLTAGNG